jgi:hypothetical protein
MDTRSQKHFKSIFLYYHLLTVFSNYIIKNCSQYKSMVFIINNLLIFNLNNIVEINFIPY